MAPVGTSNGMGLGPINGIAGVGAGIGAAGGGSVAVLSSSPAQSGASNLSYASVNALRSATPSPPLQLAHQGNGAVVWHDSQLVGQAGHAAAAALSVQGSGALPQPGEEADAILSFSLWDGDGVALPGAAAAAAAVQAQHLEQLQQQQQQQQQLIEQQQQHQQAAVAAAVAQQQQPLEQQQQQQQPPPQQQQQACSRSGSMFAGFESWSPAPSPPPTSPHSRSGAAAAALAAATGSPMAKAGSRRAGVTSAVAATGGLLPAPGSTAGATSASASSSAASSASAGGPLHGIMLGLQSGPALGAGTTAPRSGPGSPHGKAGGDAVAAAAACPQGMPAAAAALLQQADARGAGGGGGGGSVDALAQDLSTLLSVGGLRALSARLSAMADSAEQGGPASGAQGRAASDGSAAPPSPHAAGVARCEHLVHV
jgi:hypothetical protein